MDFDDSSNGLVYSEHAHGTGFGVYVAAPSDPNAARRVNAAIACLQSNGFRVTNSWQAQIAAVGEANPRNSSAADRRAWSVQCMNEIDGSDAVWLLVPDPPQTTIGAWWEACYAYSEKKHLVCSGDTKQSVFCALGLEFESDIAALSHLRELRDRAAVPTAMGCEATQLATPVMTAPPLTEETARTIERFVLSQEVMHQRLLDLGRVVEEQGRSLDDLRARIDGPAVSRTRAIVFDVSDEDVF